MIRTTCPKYRQRELYDEQCRKCAYCNIYVDAQVVRKGTLVQLNAEFDHFVPVSYSCTNYHENWVLACNVCNAVKSDQMFHSLEHARHVINTARVAKGYESAHAYYYRLDFPECGDESDTSGLEVDTGRYVDIDDLLPSKANAANVCFVPDCGDINTFVRYGLYACSTHLRETWDARSCTRTHVYPKHDCACMSRP